jgi:3D (Asp-Asp-Asp) domain-containing protein
MRQPLGQHRWLIVATLLSLITMSCGDTQRGRDTRRAGALDVSVTAYCIRGETASGVRTRRGIVAADPDVLPLGTVIRLSGLERHNGRYVVRDTGREIKGNDVDIFMPDCDAAKEFGRQKGRARIVRLAGPTR